MNLRDLSALIKDRISALLVSCLKRFFFLNGCTVHVTTECRSEEVNLSNQPILLKNDAPDVK